MERKNEKERKSAHDGPECGVHTVWRPHPSQDAPQHRGRVRRLRFECRRREALQTDDVRPGKEDTTLWEVEHSGVGWRMSE